MVYKISSTSFNDIILHYRMPSTENKGHINPVLSLTIPARALLCDCAFPSDEHFEEFKKQNKDYIDQGLIIINTKVKGAELEKIAVKQSSDKDKKIKEKFDSNLETIAESAKKNKIKMSFNVEKA